MTTIDIRAHLRKRMIREGGSMRICVAIALLVMAACARTLPTDDMIPPEVLGAEHAALGLIADRDTVGLTQNMLEEPRQLEDIEESMAQLLAGLPAEFEDTDKLTRILFEERVSDRSDTAYPVYYSAHEFLLDGGDFGIIELSLFEPAKCCQIGWIRYSTQTFSAANFHHLTLQGKSWTHYLFGALLVLVPALIIVTFVFAVRDRTLKRKWLWLIFIAVGLWGSTFNWSTGEVSNNLFEVTTTPSGVPFYKFNFFSMQLLGASIVKLGTTSSYTPWILTVGVPAGAMLYWWRRFRKRKQEVENTDSLAPTNGPTAS